MWKPSKKILVGLMILMSILCGITLSMVDWEVVENGKSVEIYREINTPLIFFGLSILFMIPYVKKIKEESKKGE